MEYEEKKIMRRNEGVLGLENTSFIKLTFKLLLARESREVIALFGRENIIFIISYQNNYYQRPFN